MYLSYLEQCRFAFWRHLTGAEAGPGSGIIIARAECDYRAPAFFGEVLEVRLKDFVIYDITDTASGRRLATTTRVETTRTGMSRARLEGAR